MLLHPGYVKSILSVHVPLMSHCLYCFSCPQIDLDVVHQFQPGNTGIIPQITLSIKWKGVGQPDERIKVELKGVHSPTELSLKYIPMVTTTGTCRLPCISVY